MSVDTRCNYPGNLVLLYDERYDYFPVVFLSGPVIENPVAGWTGFDSLSFCSILFLENALYPQGSLLFLPAFSFCPKKDHDREIIRIAVTSGDSADRSPFFPTAMHHCLATLYYFIKMR